MMLRNGNYIKKFVSGILLIVLLLVHSVKLLHSHSYGQFSSQVICDNGAVDKKASNQVSKTAADCDICSYQLAKDTDDVFFLSGNEYMAAKPNFNSSLITSGTFSSLSSFESRGPPAIILYEFPA